jgi:hypothetical protein
MLITDYSSDHYFFYQKIVLGITEYHRIKDAGNITPIRKTAFIIRKIYLS